MKHYLAGPMTGYDKGNFPLFDAAAKWLRERHVDVVSPAELDDPAVRKCVLLNIPTSQSWGDFLARDVKLIADDCGGIILLPNWEKSRGARLEAYIGLMMNLKFQTLAVIENHDLELGDPEHYQFYLLDGDSGLVRDAIHVSLDGALPFDMPSELEQFEAWLEARWGDGGYAKDPTKALAIQALGFAGETGEVVEHFKKHIRDGAPLHTTALLHELGDAFHYWMRLVQAAGFTPEQVLRANIDKLEARDAAKAKQKATIDEVLQ